MSKTRNHPQRKKCGVFCNCRFGDDGMKFINTTVDHELTAKKPWTKRNCSTPIHDQLMRFGRSCGCHQMPERSFFIKGKQFPICARCTGVLIGDLAAYGIFLRYTLAPKYYMIGCAVMFIDWFIQYIDLYPSTNIRRLLTGIIGGYSLTTFYCMVLKYIIMYLMKIY